MANKRMMSDDMFIEIGWYVCQPRFPKERFHELFGWVEHEVDFNPAWVDGSGMMHGASRVAFDQVSRFVDDRDRKAIAIPFHHSSDGIVQSLIVYEGWNFTETLLGADGLDSLLFKPFVHMLAQPVIEDIVLTGAVQAKGMRAIDELIAETERNHENIRTEIISQLTSVGFLR